MKKTIKIISVILTVVMFLSVFSAANPVIAAEVQELTTENTVANTDSENETQEASESESSENEPQIIGEDESRRDEATKHFIMSDGSRRAVMYSQPIHYRENGKWIDVDNTLTYDEDSESYINKNNSFNVEFKKKFNSENLFSIENEGYTLSWEYSGSVLRRNFINAEVEKSKETKNDFSKHTEKVNSKIKYDGFESDCELEYIVTGAGVKENIILNSKTNKNEFEFNVTAPGLVLTKNNDGSISAKSIDNTEIFYIPAPFMYDSDNVYSYDVNYELSENDGVYKVTVIADKLWLNDDARKYPVIIDPIIYTKQSSTSVSSTFIASDTPTTNYGSRQDMYVGEESACYGNCYVMFKNTLPDLEKGDMVTGANLSVYLYDTSFDGGSSKRTLDAHIITSAWSENSVTWDTKPGFNDNVIDYCFMNDGDQEWKMFDITKAVKEWYEEPDSNYGILIKSHDESLTPARAIIRSENATNITEGIPVISIEYRNNKGLEGYWSFSSFSAGTGGAGHVNDYSGNLVYEIPLMSTISEIMPVSLSLVYNSYAANTVYVSGKENSFRTTPGKGWRLNIQETVLTSEKYGLTGTAAEQYPFVYTDGDGTEHYFVKTTEKDENQNEKTVYKDEDGLGLVLTDNPDKNASYQITDKQDNSWYFNAKGNLVSIYNSNGKRILIQYNTTKDKITSVTDGAGHTLTFDYYGQDNAKLDYVLSVKDNADRTVVLNTASGYLNSIDYYDGTKTYIGYKKVSGANTGLIDYVWTTDGIGLNFDYTSVETGYRVSKVKDFAASKVVPQYENLKDGQTTTFDRTRYNTTIIRTPGIDGKHKVENSANENDDIVTTLQFDNSGRTTSQQVSYGNGGEVGAGSYNYENNKEGSKNKITDVASLGKNTVNLLKNGNAETTNNWVRGTSGTLTGTSYLAAGEYTGNYSLAVKNENISGNGASTYLRQTVSGPFIASEYTLSAFVKTYLFSGKVGTGICGAFLQLSPCDANGNLIGGTVYSQEITEDTSTGINNGWRRISTTIAIPTGTAYLKAYLCLRNTNGIAYFDTIQLEQDNVPNSVNLLENSGFENSVSGLPSGWTGDSTVYEVDSNGKVLTGVSTENKRQGSNALRISGEADAYKGFYQSIPVEGNENDTYIVSGWAAAFAVNSTFHSHYQKNGQKVEYDPDDDDIEYVEDSKFEIDVRVRYTKTDENGTTSTVTQSKDPAKFNTTINTWQYAVTPICLKYEKKADDKATYTPTHIVIMPRYNLQANYAFFDHLQLIKDVAQSYVYDSEGNLISVTKNAEQKDNITYDGENNVETYTDAIGCTTTFTYSSDKKHNLQSVTSPKGVQTAYTYDGNGLVTETQTNNAAGKDPETNTEYSAGAYRIKTGQGYTSNGAHVEYTTDEHGYKTNYTYKNTGVLDSVEYPDETTTDYEYTNNDSKLLSVKSNNTKVVYGYEGNKLSNISIGYGNDCEYNETYSFTYDEFGNIKTTKVGNVELSTNTYADNNGVLTKTTYGNGDGKIFTYDRSGNVIGEKPIYDGNEHVYNIYLWDYSTNGTPRTHTDGKNQLKYAYSYDSIGRLIRTDISSSSGSYVGSTEYGYDPRGIQTSIINSIGGKTYSQYYHYYQIKDANGIVVNDSLNNAKDGLPTRYIALGINTDYTYDSLNRRQLTTVDLERDIVTDYNYKTSARTEGTYHTNQLGSEEIDGVLYSYTYDKIGNITKIYKANALYREYTYDALNQLLSETNHIDGTRTEYEYNHLGNIRFKKIYSTEDNKLQIQTEYKYYTDTDTGWWQDLTEIETLRYNVGALVIGSDESIEYDEIGNPTTYRDAKMSWYGRQLTTYSRGEDTEDDTSDDVTIDFTYDASGLRGTKTVNGTKTIYQYVGDKLYYEKRGNKQEFYYFYDSYGKLSAIYYHYDSDDDEHDSSAVYYVTTNSQGDVIGLYNNKGVKVAAYEYDAWGNILSVTNASGAAITNQDHIANANPFRYRGYYYDADLGLYYLQSRYYDSTVGRFINADGTLNGNGDITGFNMFAYCSNNPVMFADQSGCGLWEDIKSFFGGLWGKAQNKYNEFVKGRKKLPYKTANEAAIASGKTLNELTQKDNNEHGQGIVYNSKTKTYGLTDVIDGSHSSVNFDSCINGNLDYKLVAIVHSHPYCNGHEGNVFSNVIIDDNGFSYGDWVVASSNDLDVYLAAPNGVLYIMEWDVGQYNQTEVSTLLPKDDSLYECVK